MGDKAVRGVSPILRRVIKDRLDKKYYETGGYAPREEDDFKSKLKKSMTKKDKSIAGKKIYD